MHNPNPDEVSACKLIGNSADCCISRNAVRWRASKFEHKGICGLIEQQTGCLELTADELSA